jgi:hypothetical protein
LKVPSETYRFIYYCFDSVLVIVTRYFYPSTRDGIFGNFISNLTDWSSLNVKTVMHLSIFLESGIKSVDPKMKTIYNIMNSFIDWLI